jgi:FKBP-type peptidyl-prolyl cis-trans isomerase
MPCRVLVALLTLALVTACTIKEDPTAAPRDVAAPPADALKTASGLASRSSSSARRRPPEPRVTVTVNYVGWTTEGKMVDASSLHGGPSTFKMTQVIPGWTEGVQLMVKGEKRRFWIPAKLAYGENPGGGDPGGMLVFDIELLAVR